MSEAMVRWLLCLGSLDSKIDKAMHFAHMVKQVNADSALTWWLIHTAPGGKQKYPGKFLFTLFEAHKVPGKVSLILAIF